MTRFTVQVILLALVLMSGVLPPGEGRAAVDADAAVVELRADCGTLDNCFETTAALSSWIDSTRTPDANAPLLVNIGPGRFTRGLFMNCFTGGPDGYTTFRGAGRDNTVIQYQQNQILNAGAWIVGCQNVVFQDLALEGATYAVVWYKGGSSRWVDVDLRSEGYGWYEDALFCGASPGQHYWFGSTVSVVGSPTAGFWAQCDENWFFGGEITARGGSGVTGTLDMAGISVARSATVQVFGTVVRALSDAATAASFGGETDGVTGVLVGNDLDSDVGGGVFHAHGSQINASAATTASESAVSLDVRTGGFAHTPGSSFSVSAGASGGTATRLANQGTAFSPFAWDGRDDPPAIVTVDGQDQFVETDCAADGDCEAGGSESHLMVYSAAACPTEKWLDTTTGACRNDTTGSAAGRLSALEADVAALKAIHGL